MRRRIWGSWLCLALCMAMAVAWSDRAQGRVKNRNHDSPTKNKGAQPAIIPTVKPTAKPTPSPSNFPTPLPSPASPISEAGALPEWIPIDGEIAGTKNSYYTHRLPKLLKKWPPAYLPNPMPTDRPMWLRPVRTPSNPNYFGVVKRYVVKADKDRVSAVIEDFEKLPEILSDVKEIKIILRSGNKIITQWERYSPAFFIPNAKYEMIHIFDKKNFLPKYVYRYQLREGNQLNFTDGLIVLEPDSGGQTTVTHFDFFDADFGPFRAIAEGAIWAKSLEGSFHADMAARARMENPSLAPSVIEEFVERLVQKFPLGSPEFLNSIE